MANTYTQVHLQLVFAVKYRQALIAESWEVQLHKYISSIIENHRHKLLCINGVEDHLHILIGQRPHQSISNLMEEIKVDSTKWINRSNFCPTKFQWQDGYGAFSYSKSHVPNVIRYILNQKEHHRKETFDDEYKKILDMFEIDYDERYILKSPL